MEKLQYDDIQGIILRGYKELSFASFVLFNIDDVPAARRWLGQLKVTSAADGVAASAIHLAFTAQGLVKLNGGEGALEGFAPEFREGMSGSEHRQRLLGDSYAKWKWGAPSSPVHAILLLYAATPESLEKLRNGQCGTSEAEHRERGITNVVCLPTHTLRDGTRHWFREHFGFRDGVAQPALAIANPGSEDLGGGISKASEPGNMVNPGEFLFGYMTEYGKRAEGGGPPKLAQNGTFLVFRQLEQDVIGFWKRIRDSAKEARMDPILLASKMVGRWPSGAPLVLAPEEETAGLETFDAFGYKDVDPKGQICPFSSHIRRANPRDTLLPDDPTESVKLSRTHRLVRRGRPYGTPIVEPLDPTTFISRLDELAKNPPPNGGRGLHFLCFNTSIRRQFEFIQQTWLNNPKFAGQYATPDPISGHFEGDDFEFILPGSPAATRIPAISSFVDTKGGAYFFMPGVRALAELLRTP